MNISKIYSVSLDSITDIRSVLSSKRLTDKQKAQLIITNKDKLHKILVTDISGAEFIGLMKNRPLQKFKPIKNSFTKRADKILLAETLNIQPNEVDSYISKVTESLKKVRKLNFLPKDKLDAIKTYVYRHGTTEGIATFLDYELSSSKDILKTLYTTLNYHAGGIADYFIRPVHRMSNLTLIKLYNIIDKNIDTAEKNSMINEAEKNEIAHWALIRIYQIQNNSKLINAIKTMNVLNG